MKLLKALDKSLMSYYKNEKEYLLAYTNMDVLASYFFHQKNLYG